MYVCMDVCAAILGCCCCKLSSDGLLSTASSDGFSASFQLAPVSGISFADIFSYINQTYLGWRSRACQQIPAIQLLWLLIASETNPAMIGIFYTKFASKEIRFRFGEQSPSSRVYSKVRLNLVFSLQRIIILTQSVSVVIGLS
jgi:hypothetical protein